MSREFLHSLPLCVLCGERGGERRVRMMIINNSETKGKGRGLFMNLCMCNAHTFYYVWDRMSTRPLAMFSSACPFLLEPQAFALKKSFSSADVLNRLSSRSNSFVESTKFEFSTALLGFPSSSISKDSDVERLL